MTKYFTFNFYIWYAVGATLGYFVYLGELPYSSDIPKDVFGNFRIVTALLYFSLAALPLTILINFIPKNLRLGTGWIRNFWFAFALPALVVLFSFEIVQETKSVAFLKSAGLCLFFTYLFCVPYAVLEIIREVPIVRQLFEFQRGASSRWAGLFTYIFRNPFVLPIIRNFNSEWKDGAIYLGRTLFQDSPIPIHVALKDDLNHIVVGSVGSGKSIYAIYPNITQVPVRFVLDPKGEHYLYYSENAVALDPFGIVTKPDGPPPMTSNLLPQFTATKTKGDNDNEI